MCKARSKVTHIKRFQSVRVFRFNFDLTAVIGRPIDFLRWLPRTLNTTSVFVFVDVIASRRSKFANKPNFVDLCGHHI